MESIHRALFSYLTIRSLNDLDIFHPSFNDMDCGIVFMSPSDLNRSFSFSIQLPHLCLCLQQYLNHSVTTSIGCPMQCSPSTFILLVYLCLCLQQHLNHSIMTSRGCPMQCSPSMFILLVHLCLCLQQHLNHSVMTSIGCPMQCGPSLSVLPVQLCLHLNWMGLVLDFFTATS